MQDHSGEALAAARNLRRLILENRHVTEANRQVADPIIEGLISSKLGRMALAAECGGMEVPPARALAVLETLAAAEASVAWIVWNSSLPCWFSRFLTDAARIEIFGDPAALYACSTRPSGRAVKNGDSYVVNGRWSLVSGCKHASWIPVMCMVESDGQVEMLAPNVPHVRMLFVPRKEYEVLDTWHVGGLRGTGSHDCVLKNVSVPEAQSFAMGGASQMDSPMGRMPIMSTMSAGCASICLGIAQSALQALLDLGAAKSPVDGGPGLRDRAPVQMLVGRIEAQLNAMRESLSTRCERLWNAAVVGDEIESKDIAALLGVAITTALQCRAAVTEIYAAAGTSALYTDSPIERAHRDIHAVTQHIALQPFWLEQAGRVSLGLEPSHPLFRL